MPKDGWRDLVKKMLDGWGGGGCVLKIVIVKGRYNFHIM